MQSLEKDVAPALAGTRLDRFVRREMGVSYSQFSSLKFLDCILVNGQPRHADYAVRAGERVTVLLPERSRAEVPAEEGGCDIVYEDADMFICDKPAPMPTVYSGKGPGGTLENRLAGVYGEGFVFRPLSRLDKGTSGLLAAAKNAHAYQLMQKMLHTDAYVREYLAVAEGDVEGDRVIDLPIVSRPGSVLRAVEGEGGRRSVTHLHVLARAKGRTLLRLRLETGRTHQIRVHLSAIGHPVLGDYLYGTERRDILPGRFALHSCRLIAEQPLTGERIERVSIPVALLEACGFTAEDARKD